VIAVIGVIGSFQVVFSSLGLDLAITRFFHEWPVADRRRNLGSLWVWSWVATALVGGVLLLGVSLFARYAAEVADPAWLALGVVGNAVGYLFVIPASTVRIQRLPWVFASYNLVGLLLSTGLGLYLVLALGLGLTGYLWSVVTANTVMAFVGGFLMLRFASPAVRSPGLTEALGFSARAIPSSLISAASASVDRVLLGLLGNLQTLGIYAVGMRFADVIGSLHTALKMAFGPFMMKSIASGPSGRALVAAVTPFYLMPYFVVGVALSLFIGPLVRWINEPAYFGVETLVPWLAGAAILGSAYFYFCNGIFLGKRTDLMTGPAIAQLLVLAAANLILIDPFQLAGVVASRYLGAATLLSISYLLSQRVFPFEHAWRPTIGMVLAALIAVGLGTVVPVGNLGLELLLKAGIVALFLVTSLAIVGHPHGLGPRDLLRIRPGRNTFEDVPEPSDRPAGPMWSG
jgi:O-antigen/teichoic acid export membrane protein